MSAVHATRPTPRAARPTLRAGLVGLLAALAVVASPAVGAAQTTPAPTTAAPEITAEQVGGGVLLEAADRVELAQSLADATEETGVCFGHDLSLYDLEGGNTGDEALSSAGPGVSVTDAAARNPALCPKGTLELVVDVTYTSSSSESEDSAGFSLRSTVDGLLTSTARRDLVDLTGISDDGLLGDEDDLVVRNATAALPLLVGGTPPAAAATGTAAPNGDRLTGSPGSDWMRAHGLGIAVAVGLLLLALALVIGGLTGRRQSGQPKRPGSGGSSPTTTTIP